MRVNKFVMPIVAIVALLGTVGQTDILMGPNLASDALIVCQGATRRKFSGRGSSEMSEPKPG